MITVESAAKESLSIAQMCETLGVSRIDYYRRPKEVAGSDDDLELREKIQTVALEMSAYGYRRITAELRRRGRLLIISGCCASCVRITSCVYANANSSAQRRRITH